MQQQGAASLERQNIFGRQQHQIGGTGKGLADHEVSIAMNVEDGGTALAQGGQGGGNLLLERRVFVIPNPELEQITQDVKRLGFGRLLLQEGQKGRGQIGSLFAQV